MRHAPTLGYVLAGLAVWGACPPAPAAQWSIEPQFGWLVNYNTNLLLTPSAPQATDGTTLSLDTTLKAATETTELDLHPHFDLQRYGSDSAFNADNDSLQGSFATHSELSSITLTGGYQRASTLTTELFDTGIVDSSVAGETTSAGLTLGHDFSELQHLDVQGSYMDVIYPGGERVGLVGYHYPGISLTDRYAFSPLTALSVLVFGDRLTAPLTGYYSHDDGAQLTLTHEFSMRVKVSASAGLTETTVLGDTQQGSTWDLHATRNSELGQWDIESSRTVQPSGRGYLVQRDTTTLTVSQSVAPQLYATLTVQDIRNTNLGSALFLDVPRYITGDAGFDWRLSPQVVLSFTAGVAELREPVSYQLARGWHTAFNTRWNPLPWSISR